MMPLPSSRLSCVDAEACLDAGPDLKEQIRQEVEKPQVCDSTRDGRCIQVNLMLPLSSMLNAPLMPDAHSLALLIEQSFP